MITNIVNGLSKTTAVPFLMNFAETNIPTAAIEGVYNEQKQMFVQHPTSNVLGDSMLSRGTMSATLSGASSDSDSD